MYRKNDKTQRKLVFNINSTYTLTTSFGKYVRK